MSELNLKLHPDAMFDMYYEDVKLDTAPYKSLTIDNYSVKEGTKGICVTGSNASLSVEAEYDDVLRIRFKPNSLAFEKTTAQKLEMILANDFSFDYTYKIENNKLYFSIKNIYFEYDFTSNEYVVSDKEKGELLKSKNGGARFSQEEAEYSGDKMLNFFELDRDEEIFGFGGRISNPLKTGTTVDIFPQKAGVKVGDYGGFPLPYFLSTKNYAVLFANPWPHVYFDMGKTNREEWFVHAPGGEYDLFIISAASFKDIVRRYTDISGKPSMPQKWQLGFWCSSTKFYTAEEVEGYGKRMHKEGYPCDVMVLDGTWRSGKNFSVTYVSGKGYPANDYDWHPDFGDGPRMLKELDKEGIKTVLHVNSCSFKPETFEPAVEKGLLRKVNTEVVPQLCSEEGREFYEKFMVPRIQDGCIQWWTDHSDRVSGSVAPGIPSRTTFGFLWNKFIAEVMDKYGIREHMSLSRGGGIGSQRYAMPWPGDTAFGIERYEEDLWFIQSIALAGFAMSGFDLGGFTRADKGTSYEEALAEEFDLENVCRRICSSILFVPVARIHNGDVVLPKLPWNCPEETRELYKKALEFRYKLIPYLYSYAVNSAKTGDPIIRPLVYNHTDDKNVYNIGDELYLGDYILVAPVTKKGANKRTVYLPEGEWVNYWTRECCKGRQTIEVETPLTELSGTPIFVKREGAVVWQDKVLTLAENAAPKHITIEFFSEHSAIEIYESENIKNKFSLDGATANVENNLDYDREYTVKFENMQKTVIVKANSIEKIHIG